MYLVLAMMIIGNIQVDEKILHTRFACDLQQCKGACCTVAGGRGAPIDDGEIDAMHRALPSVRKYLSQEHCAIIDELGMTDGISGSYATRCKDNRACVFSYIENGIARCGFEKAFLAGETSWRKPLSCHLFPIRVRPWNQSISFEYFEECAPALWKGEAENISVAQFLAEPLRRAFGKEWNDIFQSYRFREQTVCPKEIL